MTGNPLNVIHMKFNSIQSNPSHYKLDVTLSANALVQTRIDLAVKEEAAHVLAAMGLTVSDAVRMLLTRIAIEKQLPFAPLVPNAETIAAIKESRQQSERRKRLFKGPDGPRTRLLSRCM